jgi:gamma-carbonic anhydrase
MNATGLNILSYGDATPDLQRPPRLAAPGHALIGRITAGIDLWLGAGATIRADGHFVRIGNDLQMGRGATIHIAHDVYPTLVGDHVTVGANAVVHACEVGSGCVIEDDCVVLDGSELEPAVLLEAGSVVFPRSRLQAGQLYSGKPARPVRKLEPGELDARRQLLRACNEADDDRWGAPAPADLAPTAFIANTAVIRGVFHGAAESSLWYGCRLDAGAPGLGGAIVLGARSNVQDNSVLSAGAGGKIFIGDDSTIGHNVSLPACTVGSRCLVGIGSRLGAGTVVQDDVFIAAGATTEPGQVLASGHLYGGQPARPLAALDERKRALVMGTIPVYCDYARELKRQQAARAGGRGHG